MKAIINRLVASSCGPKTASSTVSPSPVVSAERAQDNHGFTLIELITVVALVSILAAIALPNYRVAIIQAREAVLKENLFQLRDMIDQYYIDKGQYPPTLESLVEDEYLRKLPEDPITRAPDWVEVMAEPDPDRPGEPPGVYDVHSASEMVSLAGTPYSEW
jgi:general secretion pathway protein G